MRFNMSCLSSNRKSWHYILFTLKPVINRKNLLFMQKFWNLKRLNVQKTKIAHCAQSWIYGPFGKGLRKNPRWRKYVGPIKKFEMYVSMSSYTKFFYSWPSQYIYCCHYRPLISNSMKLYRGALCKRLGHLFWYCCEMLRNCTKFCEIVQSFAKLCEIFGKQTPQTIYSYFQYCVHRSYNI